MKHRLNSVKAQTGEAVGDTERSCNQLQNVQRLSRERVGPSGSKQAASRPEEDIVRSCRKLRVVYYCRECGEQKYLPDDFYGKNRKCKDCVKKIEAARQKTGYGKFSHLLSSRLHGATLRGRANKKLYKLTDKGRAAGRRYFKSVLARHPEKVFARRAVRKAVLAGELLRPLNCSLCGKQAFVEAHHDDYLKPLEVRWLCRTCHRKTDME